MQFPWRYVHEAFSEHLWGVSRMGLGSHLFLIVVPVNIKCMICPGTAIRGPCLPDSVIPPPSPILHSSPCRSVVRTPTPPYTQFPLPSKPALMPLPSVHELNILSVVSAHRPHLFSTQNSGLPGQGLTREWRMAKGIALKVAQLSFPFPLTLKGLMALAKGFLKGTLSCWLQSMESGVLGIIISNKNNIYRH